MGNERLAELLGSRGVTITALAKMMNCGRTSLNLVLVGERSGKQTWRKLERVLTVEEYRVAKDYADERLPNAEERRQERRRQRTGGAVALLLGAGAKANSLDLQ